MSRILLQFILLVLALAAGIAQAQTLYRLAAEATFKKTCMAPCRCPDYGEEITVRGTFELGDAMPGDVFDFREISALYWTLSDLDNPLQTITGSGVYKVTNFGQKPLQELQLELSFDGGPPVHFFSDAVPLGSKGPEIDIKVSRNGFHCYDTIIRVIAAPVPPAEITPYMLNDNSTFQQGCFDPCDCILEEPRPMTG
ncbi:MAG: hypothetical protein HKN06_00015, partial [Gammaproteobacteria bacterium]|nr:hypothetical protein [Gammaproteobacteria bacterium]